MTVLSARPLAQPLFMEEPMAGSSVPRAVIVGVDTHKDMHVAVAVDQDGRVVDRRQVATTERGCAVLREWAVQLAPTVQFAVEGTGSYGAGLFRHLARRGSLVTEVRGPSRKLRHDRGKSDPIDAEAAARAVLAGTATIVPKTGDDWVEMIRVLRIARTSAMHHRSQVSNQLHALVVNAPAPLRDELARLGRAELVATAARFRIPTLSGPREATRWALHLLAKRYQSLTAEIVALDTELRTIVETHAPHMLAIRGAQTEVASTLLVVAGDNPERLKSESSFAALCGVSPLPASSGKSQRHRLNRGGDRQGNRALWWIVMSRLRNDPRTQAYARRRSSEGKSKREIVRCLKRYVAREVYAALTAT
jgi:transposase